MEIQWIDTETPGFGVDKYDVNECFKKPAELKFTISLNTYNIH